MNYYRQVANQSIGLNEVVRDVRRMQTDSAADPYQSTQSGTLVGAVSVVFHFIHSHIPMEMLD